MPIERTNVIHGALLLFAGAIVAKAAHVQIVQHGQWKARAAQLHFDDDTIPAPRGTITDASGRVLVENRELVRIRVAPRELRDRARVAATLGKAGAAKEWVRRAVDTTRKWVEVPGTFLPTDVAAITEQRGVYPQPVVQRVFSGSEGIRRVVGRVGGDGRPLDGIELALDTLLRGERGTAMMLRDGKGGALESPFARGQAARAGHAVTLTINAALQDICERALADALKTLGATGGDIVVMNPHDGDVLALASQRSDVRTTSATALSEPFEPGSTMKPLVAARLLELGRAKADEVVNTENGEYALNGRVIHDDEPRKELALRDVIRVSSNIGIVKFAQRLAPREQFEMMRDMGFGSPTGVPYPAESRGLVRPPSKWTPQSPASMAMGYEVAVTPLQLATAYAAVANGGSLLEPALVREVRDDEGNVVWRHEPRVVRRVMSPRTAATVREMLEAVVDSGTSTAADLASFTLGGKSGTARRVERGIGYAAGHYNAVFAGIFPVEDPQFVIVVKLENPQGDSYFGGKTAGPVTKGLIQAALAARDAALDRAALAPRVLPKARSAYSPKPSARDTERANTAVAPRTVTVVAAPLDLRRDSNDVDAVDQSAVRYVVRLPAPKTSRAPASPPRAVPAVQGLPLRDALYALHRAGFHVRLANGAPAGRTIPAAGSLAAAGTEVTLYRAP
ncbi:penicillin-binding protein transpeptidase [Gemmatirosa kalamazoonensis]|uniref:Penicillin-binding protein transpeptidase n=1 Tax=Gemmatirosa kalamazoonensis TaxID=861299 RepID=W0RJK1_9BACT|nr:penicillin-binding transpeptidase domain-containing protein [Gemmatirosa kalamazoonensis]AHG90607.1 penicillin-binding protein transpeptidase [Gemmatirosa kalamazoonensis]